mmetsp:Transcript_2151/g.3028  ORF Transcript_2151/g.3028 Transcript_2151/m.3028 type:complete len:212 (+) Transcript_2151:1734-2369(+)
MTTSQRAIKSTAKRSRWSPGAKSTDVMEQISRSPILNGCTSTKASLSSYKDYSTTGLRAPSGPEKACSGDSDRNPSKCCTAPTSLTTIQSRTRTRFKRWRLSCLSSNTLKILTGCQSKQEVAARLTSRTCLGEMCSQTSLWSTTFHTCSLWRILLFHTTFDTSRRCSLLAPPRAAPIFISMRTRTTLCCLVPNSGFCCHPHPSRHLNMKAR